jgi:hypothetical protein
LIDIEATDNSGVNIKLKANIGGFFYFEMYLFVSFIDDIKNHTVPIIDRNNRKI